MSSRRLSSVRKSLPILVLQHSPWEGLGTLEEPLRSEGAELHVYHHGHHDPPDPELADAFGAIVSLGGPQSANDAEGDLFLALELELLRVAVREDVPVLGICLGAHLLARALGAAVRPAPRLEIGWGRVSVTPRAHKDPIIRGFNPREMVFHWHRECFDLPREARLLLTGERTERQAFAHGGSRLGLQFHVEVDPKTADEWAGHPSSAPEIAAAGTSLLDISNDTLTYGGRLVQLARTIGCRYALMAAGMRPDQSSGAIRI
jgi:GMP synthase (glutamine-hydrolysing)